MTSTFDRIILDRARRHPVAAREDAGLNPGWVILAQDDDDEDDLDDTEDDGGEGGDDDEDDDGDEDDGDRPGWSD